ncbi:MAG: aminotransferase class V-fold PLP-dependent enzyme [Terrimicrobiaceae bacterium]
MSFFVDEAERLQEFPVASQQIFLGHAGVTAFPRCVATAMAEQAEASSLQQQEFAGVLRVIGQTRALCARAINVGSDEIALLGPTALGLGLFANGLTWKEGDEVVYFADDYPSNVYPWIDLKRLGVKPVAVKTGVPGRITVDDVREALSPKTRLVALASCHYLTGWRIDLPAIAELLNSRNVLFSLDAIQTIGAFPTDAACVDFLSADAHKWMLGPMAIGIVYVARKNFEICRPTLLGAWNVCSPDFIASSEIVFEPTARRYEPGVLNASGIYGMKAGLEMLEAAGAAKVSEAILALRDELEDHLTRLGFEFLSPSQSESLRSGILTARHPGKDSKELFATLEKNHVVASLRSSRDGVQWLRFSPHFYNTSAEMTQVAAILAM